MKLVYLCDISHEFTAEGGLLTVTNEHIRVPVTHGFEDVRVTIHGAPRQWEREMAHRFSDREIEQARAVIAAGRKAVEGGQAC